MFNLTIASVLSVLQAFFKEKQQEFNSYGQDPAISSTEHLLKSSTVISFSTVSVANGRTKVFVHSLRKWKA